MYVTNESYLASNAAIASYLGTASYAYLGCYYSVFAYFNIVGYLYEIVQFRSSAYDSGSYGGAVYSSVGADFYIVFDEDIAKLGDFLVRAVGLGRKSKAVAANDYVGMNNATSTYLAIKQDASARMDISILPDYCIGANKCLGTYVTAIF